MAVTTAGLAVVALVLVGQALAPTEATGPGKRVERDSETAPAEISRCIAYNIGKKRPDLQVRQRSGDTADGATYLVISELDAAPTTFGVIKVERSAAGSHLTTWFPARSLSLPPDELAQKLIAGC